MSYVWGTRSRSMRGCGIAGVAIAVLAGTMSMPSAQAAGKPAAEPGARPAAARQPHAAAEVNAPVPSLDWKACSSGLRCATATVPLDYDTPNGRTIELNLVKDPADDQSGKLGTLFVNPGGPGGSAAEFAAYAAQILGAPVGKYFDVVGIDPRGIGGSAPVTCRSNTRVPRYHISVPLDLGQAKPLLRYYAWERHACRTGGNAILDHMTTADTARDMDLIRQAVGAKQLDYYGVSYGTFLGETYAAMFPGRVHSMILDGVLDPISWSTGRPGFGRLPFSTRLKSGYGAWEALTSAFNECDRVGKKRCLLAGDAADKWRRIVHTLKQGPVKLGDHSRLSYSDLVSGALGLLYSRDSYRYLMRVINQVYRELFSHHAGGNGKVDPARALQRAARNAPGPYGTTVTARSSGPARAESFSPTFEGVACADSLNPSNPRAWLRAGALADAVSPWFGRVWTWASAPCAMWPGSSDDAYRGPWHHTATANPALIVGNFHDPATPIAGARTVNKLLTGSRMFSLDTWGHGALGESACVTKRFDNYLVSGKLPPNGLVCQPDKQLFPIRK